MNGFERPVKAYELFAFTLRVRAVNTDVLTDAEDSFPTRRSSDLGQRAVVIAAAQQQLRRAERARRDHHLLAVHPARLDGADRKSTRLNSSHVSSSYAVFCFKYKRRKH